MTMNKTLKASFYQRDAIEVAKDLLGCVIERQWNGVTLSGRIVETEAYLENDPACHAFRGKTPRTETMFSAGGISYVYLIYGMYHCFNAVTGHEGSGEAVLIRALEPLQGIEEMKRLRKTDKIKNLCSGPGKLCQALEIKKSENNICLQSKSLRIMQGPIKEEIYTTTRIGISLGSELPYRYYLKNNPFISKK